MNHLSDEQLAQWLAGEADNNTEAHLHTCEECRAEAVALRDGISRYAFAVRRQAAHSEAVHMAQSFAPRKVLALHRLRWAGAGVLALALAGSTTWMLHSRPPAIAFTPTASAPLPSQPVTQPAPAQHSAPSVTAPTQQTAQISDDQLLEEVNNDLSREVPQALAPVSMITTARNEIAATHLNTGTSGKVSDFEGESK